MFIRSHLRVLIYASGGWLVVGLILFRAHRVVFPLLVGTRSPDRLIFDLSIASAGAGSSGCCFVGRAGLLFLILFAIYLRFGQPRD